MLHVKGGSTTFDAPLLTPKRTEPARTAAHKNERPNRTRRVVVRFEKSDIATEYNAVIRAKYVLDEMKPGVHS